MSGEIGMDDPELRGQIEYVIDEVPCINAVVTTLVDRLNKLEAKNNELEAQIQHLKDVLEGGVNKTTRRAYLLADAVKVAEMGFITRSQARDILTEDGKRPAAKTANDAMKRAAELFGLIHTKNKAGEVVLAVA